MATTPNLGLHQWQAGDSFLRTDFNGDFSKIDAGIGGQLAIISGTFTIGSEQTQEIDIGFQPKLLIINGGSTPSYTISFITPEHVFVIGTNYINPLPHGSGSYVLTGKGFLMKNITSNLAGQVNRYIAFR